jgi:sialate O-acetylesterase
MIEDWRAAFGDEAMPFGIVGLTAGGEPQTLENFELRMVDPAPYIREGQHAAALDLEGVCFMPAYDQQVPWYHPHKKFELGERIARWALNTQYGQGQLGWKPVECIGHEVHQDHIVLRFDRAVRVHDGRPFAGFAIAGEDRHFVPAKAEFVVVGSDDRGRPRHDETQLKVSSPLVPKPVAVRYAWARNPLGNAVNSQHHERIIPIPSFRTDGWDWPEAPFEKDGADAQNRHREAIGKLRQAARAGAEKRRLLEAKEVLRSAQREP